MKVYLLIPTIGCLAFLSLIVMVLLSRPKSRTKSIFVVLCLQTFFWQAVWLATYIVPSSSDYGIYAKIAYLSITFIPVTYYQFIAEYLGKRTEGVRIWLGYGVACMLVLTLPTGLFIAGDNLFEWGHFTRPGLLYPVFLGLTALCMGRGLFLLLRGLRAEAGTSVSKNHQKYLTLAFVIYLFCTVDFRQVYGYSGYPVGIIFHILSFAVMGYAILKHSLMDIKVVLKSTLVYSFLMICTTIVYLALLSFGQLFFVEFWGERNSSVVTLVSIMLIGLLIKPIEVFASRMIDRFVFKGSIGEISIHRDRLELEVERRERLKSVGILAAGMAHEIKNPLTAIRTFAEHIPKKYDDDAFRKKLQHVLIDETQKMSRILEGLLDFSKPSEPKRKRTQLNELVAETCDLLANQMRDRSVHVELELAEALPDVNVDGAQIKQALMNILLNASECMERGGCIGVKTYLSSDEVVVAISDDGPGMTREVREHLFDPFFTTKSSGSGLGLSITHGLVSRNGGKILVSSDSGVGTTFSLVFRRFVA